MGGTVITKRALVIFFYMFKKQNLQGSSLIILQVLVQQQKYRAHVFLSVHTYIITIYTFSWRHQFSFPTKIHKRNLYVHCLSLSPSSSTVGGIYGCKAALPSSHEGSREAQHHPGEIEKETITGCLEGNKTSIPGCHLWSGI